MTLIFWLQFAAVCIAGAMSPGPSLALIIRNSTKYNRLGGIMSDISKVMTPESEDNQVSSNLNRRIVQVIGIERYIASHKPINVASHIKTIDGNPVAKRGQIPGLTPTSRLSKVIFE